MNDDKTCEIGHAHALIVYANKHLLRIFTNKKKGTIIVVMPTQTLDDNFVIQGYGRLLDIRSSKYHPSLRLESYPTVEVKDTGCFGSVFTVKLNTSGRA